jgi:DNA-binding transcriptional ArsR family regulator
LSRVAANSDVFRAIADPTRRKILDRLVAREHSVSELLEDFDITQPALSLHLRVLRDAGLVKTRKNGRLSMYSISPSPLRGVVDWLGHYDRFWNRKLTGLGAYLERKHS